MKIKNLTCVMRIGINTRFLIKDKLEGIGIYTQEVSKRLVQMHPEHEWFFFFDRTYDEQFIFSQNVQPVVIYPSARHPFLWYWWFERSLPKKLQQHKIDKFFSPDSYLSLNTNIPQILTVHDIAYEYYPETIPWLANKYYRHYFPKFCDKAESIIAISDHTRQDLVNHYQINEEKIFTIPNGVSPDFKPLELQQQDLVFHRYSGGRPFFIYVGAIHPRKNVLTLLKAFEAFKQEHPDLPHQLILVGRKAWHNEELMNFYQQMKYKDQVIWMDHIQRQDLIQLISSATAMLYLSLYEGFGLPVLEAMACGTVNITSLHSPMEEIVKDAGLIVPPQSIQEIVNAMYTVATDENYRNQLEKRGIELSKEYQWDYTAQKTSDLIFKSL